MTRVTVLIADRDKSRRDACRRILHLEKGIRLLSRRQSGLKNLSSIANLNPSILLLDFDLIKGKEITHLTYLRRMSPRVKVILITHRTPRIQILEALSYGARGYIEEIALGTFLPKAVRCVAVGEAWVPRKMVAEIIEQLSRISDCAWNQKIL